MVNALVQDSSSARLRWRRWGRLAAGIALLLAGISMLVLPGPGLVTIVFALALLERDLPVARQVLARIRSWWPDREPTTT